MKRPRAKPIYAYAIKTRHGLDLLSISESRSELIGQANKPAGQRVVPIRISEIAKAPKPKKSPPWVDAEEGDMS